MAFPFGKPQATKHTEELYLTGGIYTGSTLLLLVLLVVVEEDEALVFSRCCWFLRLDLSVSNACAGLLFL